MKRRVLLSAAAVACTATLACAPVSAQPVTPLFASDEPIAVTLSGPMGSLQRDRSEKPRPGTLTSGAEQLAITLSPRGITRRREETCQFPPLRVQLQPRPATGLFAGQGRLKLVTHCRSAENFQQYVLLEYAAYRLLNLVSPAALRVRLAQIDYRAPDGKPFAQRVGFFIEDWDDAARRSGHQRSRVGDAIFPNQLSRPAAARAALFEYMIGNLDWSMRAGTRGQGCCHNFRLFGSAASAGYVPVPYDFDYSGFVDAPYAVPPEQLGVADVRDRQYRGYCFHNAETLAAAADFRAKRPEMLAVLASVPGLSEGSRRKASAYLESFFADIADETRVRARLLKTCVG